MKKLLIIMMTFLMLFSHAETQANVGETINKSTRKPTSGTFSSVNIYDNNSEYDTKEVKVTYDRKGRVFDDGVYYHLYDRNGHEIMTASADDYYAYFGIEHIHLYGNYEIDYNSDGTVRHFRTDISRTGWGKRYDLTFAYDTNGNIAKVVHKEGVYDQTAVYTYENGRVSKIVVTSYEGAYPYHYETTHEFNYGGDKLQSVFTTMNYNFGRYIGHYITEYSYSGNKLAYVSYRNQDYDYSDEYSKPDYDKYTYDSAGNLTSIEGLYYTKGTVGFIIRYKSGGKKTRQKTNVYLENIKPYSNQQVDKMYGQLVLEFSQRITSVDLSQGVYFRDMDTGENVYNIERYGINKKQLNLYISAYAKDNLFKPGHRYCLIMSGSSIEFEKSSYFNGFEHPDFDDMYSWVVEISGRQEEVISKDFHFSSTKDFDSDSFREGTGHFVCKNEYFRRTSTNYNSELAELSLDMAMASYNYENDSQGDKYIKEFFTLAQFSDILSNDDYHKTPGENTVGICIANKKIDDVTLIAIAIRSGGYKSEWYDNFQVGNGKDHSGFSRGRQKVIDFLNSYIQKYNITGRVKFWVAGYSRGSAIANLTAAHLIDGDLTSKNITYYKPQDVYAYCFEVPASTKNPMAASPSYRSIYNIVNPYDIVVRLPLMQWGYTRYGRVLFIPHDQKSAAYKDNVQEVLKNFTELYGQQKKDGFPQSQQVMILNFLMNTLYNMVPTLDKYNIFLENALSTIAKLKMGKGSINRTEEIPVTILGVAFLLNNIKNAPDDLSFSDIKSGLKNALKGNKNAEQFNFDNILFAHYAEYTLAWIKALNGSGIMEQGIEDANSSMTSKYAKLFVKVHCPVSVSVFADENRNELLAEIRHDDQAVTINDEDVEAYIDDTEAKVFVLPQHSEAYLILQASGEGNMSINIYSQDEFSEEVYSYVYYDSVPLNVGSKYLLEIDSSRDPEDLIYTSLCDRYNYTESQRNYFEPAEEKTYDGIDLCSVTVNCEGNGYAYGVSSIVPGDYVSLTATPEEKNQFDGWYDEEGNLLSSESSLVLQVSKDVSVTARFSEKKAGGMIVPVILGIGGMAAAAAVLLLMKGKKKTGSLH